MVITLKKSEEWGPMVCTRLYDLGKLLTIERYLSERFVHFGVTWNKEGCWEVEVCMLNQCDLERALNLASGVAGA